MVDFGKTAEDYRHHRAGFPPELLDRLAGFGVGGPGQRLLDVGTGTGTLAYNGLLLALSRWASDPRGFGTGASICRGIGTRFTAGTGIGTGGAGGANTGEPGGACL